MNDEKEYLNGQDKTTMGLIALFLGGFGVHNFILGEKKKGIFKIIMMFCMSIGAILGIIDAVRIFTGKYEINPDKLF